MIKLEKPGKTSGNGLLRWIIGLIFVLIVIAGINAGIKDVPLTEESQQAAQQTAPQAGDTDLEAQIRAEDTASGQDSGLAENNLANGGNPTDENLTVHFLDVGQGDSVLLEYNGKAMLVDAGERNQGSGVSAYLHEHDISSIAYVVATHPHSDHIGGMDEVLRTRYEIT